MATDYGTDVAALEEMPDPEALISGELNVAYAMARRLVIPSDAMKDIGDPEPYDSIDLHEWLGRRPSQAELRGLERQVDEVLRADPRVRSVTAKVSFVGGRIVVDAEGEGENGPFGWVMTISDATSASLRVT